MGQRLVLTGKPEQPAPEMSFDRYFVVLGYVAASLALLSSYAIPPFWAGRQGRSGTIQSNVQLGFYPRLEYAY